nr:hypothetical protein [Klebsiella pneumoniae]
MRAATAGLLEKAGRVESAFGNGGKCRGLCSRRGVSPARDALSQQVERRRQLQRLSR